MSERPPRSAVVVLAGGSGRRVGAAANKVLLPLAGTPVLARSVRAVLDVAGVHRVVLVVRGEDREAVAEAVAPVLGSHDLWVVEGGAERHDSEWAALRVLATDIDGGAIDVVAIHDGARPLAPAALYRTVLDTAHRTGAAVPVVATGPLLRRDGTRLGARVGAVQTPQAFSAVPLLAAYRQAAIDGFRGTDTAACWERYAGTPVTAVPGTAGNLKITWPEDVGLAGALLSARGRS
ncbi:MAG: IspD/TarI family cytidylyltransferase [Marmoricola sp.]